MSAFVDDLVAVARLFGLSERDAVCCGTVTVPQCVALQALLPGEQLVSELAGLSGTSPSATTRLVDGLAKRGWVARVRSTQDRRKVAIALTESGRGEAQRLRDLTEQSVGLLLEQIPADKREQVVESLGLVRTALEKARRGLSCC